jgi:hypothetical protein
LERLKGYQKGLILAVILAVVAFFWILFYEYIGSNSYWVALVAFAVYVAYGSRPRKLPLMVLGGVLGTIFGVVTFALSMLVFPTYLIISSAIAGAILILIGALVSVPRMNDLLPMTIVGWGCFIGAMLRWESLIGTKVVWAIPKIVSTLFGVILSLIVGLLIGALIATPLLGTASAAASE